MSSGNGRFAPTPSADLHIGNLRTALVAFLSARASGRDFLIRVEDLDVPRLGDADAIMERQLEDLGRLGICSDGPVVRQSERTAMYVEALSRVESMVYECFCSRKDVAEATRAPHGTTPFYPGTCRNLTESQKAELRKVRQPCLRINASSAQMRVTDLKHGSYTGLVDDFVVRRADGVFSYNFAVVVDDGLQGVREVVRGDDLLESSPRQAWLATRLGFDAPVYLHVPLVLSPDGTRLAKRDQAVTLTRLRDAGVGTQSVLSHLAVSLGLAEEGEPVTLPVLADRFDLSVLPSDPWYVDPMTWV